MPPSLWSHDGPTVADLGEDRVIALFGEGGGKLGEHVVVPNGDDAAVFFSPKDVATVVTTDCLVEEVHFTREIIGPRALGSRLVAINVSDIAAMGALPRYAFLSCTLPRDLPQKTLTSLARGLHDRCAREGIAILGGNVSSSPGPLVLTATLIGRCDHDRIVRRRGAHAGDDVWVTGTLGASAAGLHRALEKGPPEPQEPERVLYEAWMHPPSRVKVAHRLAKAGAPNAMCDLSDGLARDLTSLLRPEGLGARIRASWLPVHPATRAYAGLSGRDALAWALDGGEGYELLFTAAPDDHDYIVDLCRQEATPVHRIGVVTPEPELLCVSDADDVIRTLTGGFDHFQGAR